MTELTQDLSLAQAHSLIDSYAFDLGGDDAEQLLGYWLDIYHASWIRLATIEALYLGRYKAISVEHILNVWLRIGNPNTHFTFEFERLICRKLPKHLTNFSDLTDDETKTTGNSQTEVAFLSNDKLVCDAKELNHKQITTSLTKVKPTQAEISQPENATSTNDTLNLAKAWGNSNSSDTPSSSIPLISTLGEYCKSDWSEFTIGNRMIHQFIPLPDMSSFFNKLKTFGEEKLEGQ